MKNITATLKNLLRKGQHNIMKITSLAIGLALGLVLIAKVAFEQSYDGFWRDSDRIYRTGTRQSRRCNPAPPPQEEYRYI